MKPALKVWPPVASRQMALQVAHAERHADAGLGERPPRRAEDAGARLERARCERNIRRHHDVALARMLGDPVVGGVGASGDRDVTGPAGAGWGEARHC